MTSLASLRSLHATIGAALDDIERVYSARGLDFPSLDTPFYDHQSIHSAGDDDLPSAGGHEGNSQLEAENLSREPEVVSAVNKIVAACGQLGTSVQLPFYVLLQTVHLGHITAALSFLEASHAVDILRNAGPEGLHAVELAPHVADLVTPTTNPDKSSSSFCRPSGSKPSPFQPRPCIPRRERGSKY
ncbi:hypothetical protein NUW54_g3873 [Trametes sanguinea]|uniref:Uncharacterized protein n=1 Tax=Trametes sanguinea TaxID=158606 RepID=A0ACC1Q1N2_9APHY|nr:hypothetical protein NUW54_g3873 [Trametes sanguinea]